MSIDWQEKGNQTPNKQQKKRKSEIMNEQSTNFTWKQVPNQVSMPFLGSPFCWKDSTKLESVEKINQNKHQTMKQTGAEEFEQLSQLNCPTEENAERSPFDAKTFQNNVPALNVVLNLAEVVELVPATVK